MRLSVFKARIAGLNWDQIRALLSAETLDSVHELLRDLLNNLNVLNFYRLETEESDALSLAKSLKGKEMNVAMTQYNDAKRLTEEAENKIPRTKGGKDKMYVYTDLTELTQIIETVQSLLRSSKYGTDEAGFKTSGKK